MLPASTPIGICTRLLQWRQSFMKLRPGACASENPERPGLPPHPRAKSISKHTKPKSLSIQDYTENLGLE